MKKLKLSNKLKEESVEYLRNYLKRERPHRLPLKKRELIKKLITKREKECDKEAWLYVNSSLCHLAQEELVRERRADKIIENGKITYKIPSVAEMVLKMLEIVNLAHDKGYGDILNSF